MESEVQIQSSCACGEAKFFLAFLGNDLFLYLLLLEASEFLAVAATSVFEAHHANPCFCSHVAFSDVPS